MSFLFGAFNSLKTSNASEASTSPHTDYHPKIPIEARRYVVFIGLHPGVYNTAQEALAETDGVPRQNKKMFPNADEAHSAYSQALANHLVEQAVRLGSKTTITPENLNLTEGQIPASSDGEFYVVVRGRRAGIFGYDY
ncbi:hypothetical protein CPB83DRAFT_841270 [Crepidotus variabilis]|uniref:Ribonuclease H1 N-terminal domain-containing protein n=1 Tax=Crepidotus variabilis TaxID=179855 RepID=A0A9P6BC78_9AGAR|nr:hypothetical protein CPB83DRAFT_841346 [Crepidotus variabilis]KAF9521432.1 hypothetical protein CPB83DRAFT_841270 [Crepidotus variabilis]